MSAKIALGLSAGAAAEFGGIGNAGSDSGRQGDDLGIVSGDQGQIGDQGSIGDASERAGIRLKKLGVSSNRYSLLDPTGLQFDIKPRGFGDIDLKPVFHRGFEPYLGELD